MEEESGASSSTKSSLKTTKKRKVEGRLSELLNKIRQKNVVESTKTKRIQVKWKRYDILKNEYKNVRAGNGGGMRSVEVPCNETFTFGDLKDKVIPLYYNHGPLSSNYFMEQQTECVFEISSPAGATLNDDVKVWNYIEENCLVISKTTFHLLSKSMDIFATTNESLSPSICCTVCGYADYLTDFGNCLRCLQSVSSNSIMEPTFPNVEINATPNINAPIEIATEIEVIPVSSCTPPSSPDLPAVLGVERTNLDVYIHRTSVRKDLMDFFKNNKVLLYIKNKYIYIYFYY